MLMHFMEFGPDVLIPMMVFAIPIVAIVGGITAGIVRNMGQQRLIENAQRERIAAIERGIDPAKLPPLNAALMNVGDDVGAAFYLSPTEFQRRRSQGLMVGGIVTLCVGIGLCFFLYYVDTDHEAWAVGIVPGAVGIGLLLSSWLVRPKNGTPAA